MERNVDLSFTARKEKGESNYHGYRVHVNRGIKYQKRRRKKKKKEQRNYSGPAMIVMRAPVPLFN